MGNLLFEREAPAKVNLSLKILGKRADGFHELETRMVRISVTDTLRAESAEPGKPTVSTASRWRKTKPLG